MDLLPERLGALREFKESEEDPSAFQDADVTALEERYQEVVELSRLRRQALQDALALYRLRSEAGSCDAWMEEKEQWLSSMEIPARLEDLEVVQHRSVPEETPRAPPQDPGDQENRRTGDQETRRPVEQETRRPVEQ